MRLSGSGMTSNQSSSSHSHAPRVEELEKEREFSPLMVQFLSALRGEKGVDLSPSILTLTSLITQYVKKQSTTAAINATITLHGMIRM